MNRNRISAIVILAGLFVLVAVLSTGCMTKKYDAVLTTYQYDQGQVTTQDHEFAVWDYAINDHYVFFSADRDDAIPAGSDVDFGKISRIQVHLDSSGGWFDHVETHEVTDCAWEGGTGFQSEERYVTCDLER